MAAIPSHERLKVGPAADAADRSSQQVRRRFVLIALLLVLVLCFYLSGGFARIANQWASSAIVHRDYETAKRWLERSLALDPTSATAHFLRARVARHEGDLGEMAAQLSLAARLGFDQDRIRLERDLARAQSGQLEGIEDELSRRLMDADIDSAEICEAYSNGLSKSSRFAEALEVLDAWQRDRPDDPMPRYRMGRIEEYIDQPERAKESYRAAIALDHDFYPAMFSLGRVWLDENNSEESSALFERCLKMPNPAAAKVGLAMALSKVGESARAKKLLYEVISLDLATIKQSYTLVGEPAERFVAAAELGKLLVSEGDYNEAVRLLDMALAENPRDLAARYSRGMALRGLGRNEEATADMEQVEKTKDELEKVNALRHQINRDPEDVESRVKLGQLLIEVESQRSGLFWLRSALLQGSDNPLVHQALADFYESHVSEAPDYADLARSHRARQRELEAK